MKSTLDLLKKNTMVIVLVIVYLFFTIMTKGQMFQALNFNALITQNAYVYVLGVGMLMCMLTGGNIDLSCGSFVCFVGAVGGVILSIKGWGTAATIILMLVIGIIYGCLLGWLIAYVNIPPWIATLAGYLAFRGWGVAILSGNSSTGSISLSKYPGFIGLFSGKLFETPVTEFNTICMVAGIIGAVIIIILNFSSRATKLKKGYEADSFGITLIKSVVLAAAVILFGYKLAKAGGIPTALVWVIVVVLIYNFITDKTTIGRYFYTIGGNREATRLSGINTKMIMFLAYLNMAFLTVVTGYLVVSRFQTANSTAGTNYEMDAISACVVGGVSAYGGAGTVFGMVVGATLIGVINLGMSLMGIDANWQKVVKGVVLLGAVVFDILSKKNQAVK